MLGGKDGIDFRARPFQHRCQAGHFGRDVADKTAEQMEYQGRGWLDATSNAAFAKRPPSSPEHPICIVCWMDVDPKTADRSVYKGTTYYFCMRDHKTRFDSSPETFLG